MQNKGRLEEMHEGREGCKYYLFRPLVPFFHPAIFTSFSAYFGWPVPPVSGVQSSS
jgi:hypothetical protein